MSSDSYQLKFHRSEYASIDQISTDSPKRTIVNKSTFPEEISASDSISEERILSPEIAFGNLQAPALLSHSDWEMESEESENDSERIVTDGKLPVSNQAESKIKKTPKDIFLQTPKIVPMKKTQTKKNKNKKTEKKTKNQCLIEVGIPPCAYDLADSIPLHLA